MKHYDVIVIGAGPGGIFATYELAKMKKELFNLRFQHVTGQLENPVKMREVKREIARVKTILREKELAKAEA